MQDKKQKEIYLIREDKYHNCQFINRFAISEEEIKLIFCDFKLIRPALIEIDMENKEIRWDYFCYNTRLDIVQKHNDYTTFKRIKL